MLRFSCTSFARCQQLLADTTSFSCNLSIMFILSSGFYATTG
jgi:hypothetical protein